jgi:hypothetical protein
MPCHEGCKVNHKRSFPLYQLEGLKLRHKKRKGVARTKLTRNTSTGRDRTDGGVSALRATNLPMVVAFAHSTSPMTSHKKR